MKLPCEIAVKSVVPAIRALLAKELVEAHGMKQSEAAKLLGITQTAVSKYTHNVRGKTIPIENEKEIRVLITRTATSLANGEMDRTTILLKICTTCNLVRKKGLMCKLCRRSDPQLDVRKCKFCILLDEAFKLE